MKNITGKISELKKIFKDKQKSDNTTNKALSEALFVVFGKNIERFVRSRHWKGKILFLETVNKSFAQELAFRKTELIKEINKKIRIVEKVVIL